MKLLCASHTIELDEPVVMGILNVTPDSFADGGRYGDLAHAIAHGRQMAADGAAIVDVGGESTRPGSSPVSDDEELRRVVPVVGALARDGFLVSVDTRRAAVMRAAIAAGAVMVNDVAALREPGAMEAVARSGVAVCLVHMQGEPATMQDAPRYGDVAAEVLAFLAARARAAEDAGIARERIAVDPGFGFGKTLEHNLRLMRALPRLVAAGYPVLVGLSRKGSLGTITGRPVEERLPASLAAALAAVARGAAIVRVHDVRATVDALKVWRAFERG
ncbi:MAG TPA: dihydropteroate synthase [Casimicrobiaceae bacterium]|nr:dihydropteroate synthase [Casimicrobiaceae bacterium]